MKTVKFEAPKGVRVVFQQGSVVVRADQVEEDDPKEFVSGMCTLRLFLGEQQVASFNNATGWVLGEEIAPA